MKQQLSSIVAVLVSACAVTALTFPDCENGPSLLTQNLVCDPTASPPDRASALVRAMNISEKLVNLVDMSQGTSRLGLPPYKWWSEALHGVASSPGVDFAKSGDFSYATSFANPILLAAAFDDPLVESIANVVSTEARAFSNAGRAGLDFWTPNINPYKDPRWGRGMETPGEDPFRIKGYVKHLLAGLEGPKDPYTKIIATCKHYAAYDLERWNDVLRYNFDAVVSTQDLSEYYLPPFQQCARDSRVSSIMCSYNAVNAVPACANTYLMQTILRDHWNWTNEHQYITSDCNAVHNIYADHGYVKNAAEAAAFAYTAGTDTVCEAGGYPTDVTGAYNSSRLTEAVIDRALRRQFEGLVRVGYFDPASATPYRSLGWNSVNSQSSQTLARASAADGMVLLKNNGILPLSLTGNLSSVAIIGMWANATTQMLGGYSGIPPFYHNPLYAAQKLGLDVRYANGPNAQNQTDGNWTEPAVTAAKDADVVIYFGGIDLTVESEDKDRYSISWSPSQLALIQKVCALGKPCIVVQLGDQLDDTPLLNNANVSAVLWAGYPGQDGGTAVFDLLTGVVSPAGRLPVTQYPGDYVDQVPMTDMGLRQTGINPGRTYRFFNNAVLPFGYGLHYTNFSTSFANSSVSQHSITSGKSYDIDQLLSTCKEQYLDLCAFPDSIAVQIQNRGNRTSDFVALAFLTGQYGPRPYPLKTLAAYSRARDIQPGEKRNVELSVTLGNLARVDEKGNTVLYPGNYSILLDVPTQASFSFSFTGKSKVLDAFPQPPPDEGNLKLTNNTKPW